ncbi:polyhydroxyalkanoate synthesis repressor PhaR [Formivibrio citricus]|uniref:Polyhydroxyalkanoate synthesis repressor PhaR n=1 Tax=Formivibrio citricus TaxID=83765 RepID=A0A1I5D8G2_9NEIS|nr:polyhydroxyalkanoate synthesis repressor PhaR [Formivibrio citricus]SFN95564.1 polyhydroxyalkanoate synthesis repressor PhaR [Formivibrio citricus]
MSAEKLVIKKYPNRRLYDTSTSSYITLADVKQLVLDNVEIQVLDAKTGEDLTRSVLLQIIMDEESGAMPMFSYDALTQLIRFYGNAMQGLMGNFLDKNMALFMQMQDKLGEQTQSVISGENPVFSNPQLWGDFMKFQGPSLQKMMGDYLESGASMFMQMQQQMQQQMQEQLQEQARGIFAEPEATPATSAAPAAPAESAEAEPKKAAAAKPRTATRKRTEDKS